MTRDKLLNLICDVHPCVDFNLFFNNWLDEYDKHVIEQYKANINLKDTIKDIHDNVAQEMYCKGVDDMFNEINTCRTYDEYVDGMNIHRTYDEYVNVLDVLEIVKRLKAGVKNE